MCDPFAPLKPTPLCDLEVASRGYSVHTVLGSTLSTAPESKNASNSFPPRVLSWPESGEMTLSTAPVAKEPLVLARTLFRLVAPRFLCLLGSIDGNGNGISWVMKRQSQRKTAGQSLWRESLSARSELHSHPLAEQA